MSDSGLWPHLEVTRRLFPGNNGGFAVSEMAEPGKTVRKQVLLSKESGISTVLTVKSPVLGPFPGPFLGPFPKESGPRAA